RGEGAGRRGALDYTATAGTVTFAPGTTAQQVTVAVQGDTVFEANETFQVTLASPVNATILDGTGIGTIVNDDPPPTVSINDVTVTEGNTGTTNAGFTGSLSAASGLPTTVAVATANGVTNPATAGTDYTSVAATLTFAPGVTTQLITVAVTGDAVFEVNETFLVNLASPTNATILDGQGVGTITNDDPPPTLSINDVSVTEGNTGTTNAVFTVTLNGASALPATVSFATADGTATTANLDYAAASGTLTFNPGTTTQLITVAVQGDTTNEPNETFNVNLSAPLNATIADGQGDGTILNDDAATH